ncbi:MAG: pyridoxal phosphate-dependent aminotransferase [Chthonomonadales bacterium]|nr:pyridoxal phosphate-dependent aminotransferase [Chthonomonadales bacterium]
MTTSASQWEARPLGLAARMAQLGTETAFDVLAKVHALRAEGRDIISFGLGEPDFETPDHIKAACKQALDENYTHYGPSQGLPELREAIAEYFTATRNIAVSAENVVVAPGAKPMLFSAMMALVNPGDEVIYPSPGYPIYESVADWIGAKPVPARLTEETEWSYNVDELAALVTPRTRAIVLNSPQNPTGGMLLASDMAAIAKIAMDHDLWVITDEVYSQIVFNYPFASILSVPGMEARTVAIDGFSKTYAMTGWRIGYAVCRADLAKQLSRIETNLHSCTAMMIQRAALAALRSSQEPSREMAAAFRRRATLITDLLNEIPGVRCVKPRGAFYVFPNVTGVCRSMGFASANELCDYLLNEAGVAVLPRTCFGRRLEDEEYIRLSYATSDENIVEGLRRFRKAVERR